MASLRRVGEFEEVVGGAEQGPLGPDVFETTKKELAEAPGVLDLTEDRLDDLFAQAIATAPTGALELGGHRSDARTAAPLFATRLGVAVTQPAGRHIGFDPAASQMGKVVFRTEARIGGDFLGIGTKRRACRHQ